MKHAPVVIVTAGLCLVARAAAADVSTEVSVDRTYVRADVGLFMPTGLAGVTVGRHLGAVGVEAGAGIGPFGLQLAGTARLGHRSGAHRIGVDAGYSVAPGAQVESDLVGGDYPAGIFQLAHAGVGYEYQLANGWLFGGALGAAYLLDRPEAKMGFFDLLEEGQVLPTVRLGVGRGF